MRTRKMAEELRMRLSNVMQPEGPQKDSAGQSRPSHGCSPLVGSFVDLAQAAEGTAEVLADILRRLEV